MPPNCVTAGKKKTRVTYAATPVLKHAKKMPKKNLRPLTTDNIPILIREVCKNLSLQQMEAEESHGESCGDGRCQTRQITTRDREAPSQGDRGDNTHTADRTAWAARILLTVRLTTTWAGKALLITVRLKRKMRLMRPKPVS